MLSREELLAMRREVVQAKSIEDLQNVLLKVIEEMNRLEREKMDRQ